MGTKKTEQVSLKCDRMNSSFRNCKGFACVCVLQMWCLRACLQGRDCFTFLFSS